jgi:hypothetical protein
MVHSRHTRYLNWVFESTPETVRRWIPEQQLQQDLRSFFDRVWVERAETPEWLAGYARACPVDTAEPHDYRMREIELRSGAGVLAGIHFRNRDVTYPFVEVFAQTRDFDDPEMAAATSELLDVFSLFNAAAVLWWAPEQRDLSELEGTRDHRLVVGRIQDITSGSSTTLPERFSFEPETAARCYQDYVQAYAEFGAQATFQNPPRPEQLPSLEECERRGALYCLRDGARFAGLMAARSHSLRGITGWEIVEEILGTDYRGKGLGVAMQRLFVSGLDPRQGVLVMGEIADGNLPSLRTAQRAGRKDVGGWVRLTK